MTPPTSITVTAPVESFTVDTGLLRLDEAAAATVAQATPTAEQMQAAETAFAQDSQADVAWGLLGIWTSTVLLHDLALEAFTASPNQEKKQTKVRPV